MKYWRNIFLQQNDIETYRLIQDFFTYPSKEKASDIVSRASDDKKDSIKSDLNCLIELHRTNLLHYNKVVITGQAVVWDEVLRCYLDIQDLVKRFEVRTCVLDKNNYSISAAELTNLCDCYSKIQSRISSLEKTLGADRFLDRIGEDYFALVENMASDCRQKLDIALSYHKDFFQEKWNTTSVSRLVVHKLYNQIKNDVVCELYQSNQDRVILFVIDGFGYCQYLWHSHLDDDRHSYTYNENLFGWLRQEECSRCYPIGSTFISDTAAGLSQIYIGQSPKVTGIIASKCHLPGRPNRTIDTKRIEESEFNQLFDTRWNNLFDVLVSYGINSKIYYCSRYGNDRSGFSRYTFGSASVVEVVPSERVFSMLLDDINHGSDLGLHVVYHTGIDNTGHPMGAYSNFERYEHAKLNGLFRNFLIELAESKPELFNGRCSIIITSDHGMAESAKLMISRSAIKNVLVTCGEASPMIIENNRAMFIYNISNNKTSQIKSNLEHYFNTINVTADIVHSGDKRFEHFFCTDQALKQSKLVPQIVIRLIDNGLFYSNKNISPHLLHYGGHGGAGVDEVFVPLLDITLDQKLLSKLKSRFIEI